MHIKLKGISGKDKDLEVDGTYTLNELKEIIQEYELIPPQQQRLICNGKILVQGDKTLLEYKISSNNVIHVVLAMRGG